MLTNLGGEAERGNFIKDPFEQNVCEFLVDVTFLRIDEVSSFSPGVLDIPIGHRHTAMAVR